MRLQCLSIKKSLLMAQPFWSALNENPILPLPENFFPQLNYLRNALWYTPRDEVETDPTFVQFLPYLVVIDSSSDTILGYNRPSKNAEARLAGNFSVGIGGHVDIDDWCAIPESTLKRCMERELNEELGCQIYEYVRVEPNAGGDCELVDGAGSVHKLGSYLTPAYLIYDQSNPVGQVHLGIVYVLDVADLNAGMFTADDNELVNLRVMDTSLAFNTPNPENWTSLVLREFM